jgi:hypothetical protein
MTSASFRFALLLALLILAGCGGSPPAQPQLVRGKGFSFNAPAGWKVTGSRAQQDSQLVQVATFALLHPYSDALFGRVKQELDSRMQAVAKQAGGSVTDSRTVTVDGRRAHSYQVTAGKDVLEYTFVLRGLREYELLCRRPSSASDDACKLLLTSFAA